MLLVSVKCLKADEEHWAYLVFFFRDKRRSTGIRSESSTDPNQFFERRLSAPFGTVVEGKLL